MSKSNTKVLNQIVSLATKNGISAADITAALKSQKPPKKAIPAKKRSRAAWRLNIEILLMLQQHGPVVAGRHSGLKP